MLERDCESVAPHVSASIRISFVIVKVKLNLPFVQPVIKLQHDSRVRVDDLVEPNGVTEGLKEVPCFSGEIPGGPQLNHIQMNGGFATSEVHLCRSERQSRV